MKKFSKKWRKLSKIEKVRILVDYYNLNESDIQRIQRIDNPTEKLTKAAALQFESFKNIHNDITAWIAGYSSESSVRSKLGTRTLRKKFFEDKSAKNNFAYSYGDYRRCIEVPNDMNEDLAEETGIHIGDGSLAKRFDGRWYSYPYRIDGCLIDETSYHDEWIAPLMKKLYNIKGFKIINRERNSTQLNFKSRLIYEFKVKTLGLPPGNKKHIQIPKQITENNECAKRCLVGIMDTDFTLANGSYLGGTLSSLRVIRQMSQILTKNKIVHTIYRAKKYPTIRIHREGSLRILENWKMHNAKHTSKHEIKKEYNDFLPYTTTPERMSVLRGLLDFESLKKISKTRQLKKMALPVQKHCS